MHLLACIWHLHWNYHCWNYSEIFEVINLCFTAFTAWRSAHHQLVACDWQTDRKTDMQLPCLCRCLHGCAMLTCDKIYIIIYYSAVFWLSLLAPSRGFKNRSIKPRDMAFIRDLRQNSQMSEILFTLFRVLIHILVKWRDKNILAVYNICLYAYAWAGVGLGVAVDRRHLSSVVCRLRHVGWIRQQTTACSCVRTVSTQTHTHTPCCRQKLKLSLNYFLPPAKSLSFFREMQVCAQQMGSVCPVQSRVWNRMSHSVDHLVTVCWVVKLSCHLILEMKAGFLTSYILNAELN